MPTLTLNAITVESRDSLDIVSLNRPDVLNAVNLDMLAELSDYFTGMKNQPQTRVVILRGNGTAFCAGGEVGGDALVPSTPGGQAQARTQKQAHASDIIRAMRGCPQPIIGLIQGPACGAGFSFALACDVRIATPSTRMNAAYVRIGLSGTDLGSGYFLPRLVGLSAASEYLMTGRFIGAERARSIGLVSDVVDEDALLDAGLQLASDMLRTSPMGLRMTKDAINRINDISSLDTALVLEDRQQVLLMETDDFREGLAAFQERRPPVYLDR